MIHPFILLQIEVLGVSLPWRGVFTNEGSGAQLVKLSGKNQVEKNSSVLESDANPLSDASLSSGNVSSSVQQGASTNPWADLLTGGDMFTDPISESVTNDALYEGGHPLDFLDQAVIEYGATETNHEASPSRERRPSDSGSHEYINLLKSLTGSHKV